MSRKKGYRPAERHNGLWKSGTLQTWCVTHERWETERLHATLHGPVARTKGERKRAPKGQGLWPVKWNDEG